MVDLTELCGSEVRLEKSFMKCNMYSRHTCVHNACYQCSEDDVLADILQ